RQRQLALERAEREIARAARPLRIELQPALAAVDAAPEAEARHQLAEVAAVGPRLQPGAAGGAAPGPAAGDVERLLRRTRLQALDLQPRGALAGAQLQAPERQAAEAEVLHVQRQRRDAGRIDRAAVGR